MRPILRALTAAVAGLSAVAVAFGWSLGLVASIRVTVDHWQTRDSSGPGMAVFAGYAFATALALFVGLAAWDRTGDRPR